jgi:uncharacterized protein with FMN-binding domain
LKRALAAVFGTIAGLVALLGYKSGGAHTTVASGPLTSLAPQATTPTTAPAPGGTPTTAPAAGATRKVDGPDDPNQYGDVQVEITVEGTRIVDVEALQLPQDRRRSAEISQDVAPILRSEALAAQSAQIDSVSGATYTSQSYAQSLQAAIDQARGS